MHKVITINLNGNAFQLDEPAYEALRAYLDRAADQLKDNPDRAEIMADIEQAIGEKCSRFLGSHKTVVANDDVAQVIKEMGPVESGIGEEGHGGSREETRERTKSDPGTPKRLYNIREGAIISGVCNGLAAYLHIDVTIVRIAFVILAIVTKGAWMLAYVVLMFVVPYANTSEERAAARGLPFNAQEVVDQAKKHFTDFKIDNREWKRQWRDHRRQWRRQWRATRGQRWWGPGFVPPVPPMPPFSSMHWPFSAARPAQPPMGYGAQVFAGIAGPIFGIIHAALFVFLLFAIMSLVNTRTILGWPIPPGIPLWGGILLIVAAYTIVSGPVHAIRRASNVAYNPNYPWFAAWGGLLWLGVSIFGVWLAYQHLPEVQQFFQNLPAAWNDLRGR